MSSTAPQRKGCFFKVPNEVDGQSRQRCDWFGNETKSTDKDIRGSLRIVERQTGLTKANRSICCDMKYVRCNLVDATVASATVRRTAFMSSVTDDMNVIFGGLRKNTFDSYVRIRYGVEQ